jgi:DNA-binding NtrC family response regulator
MNPLTTTKPHHILIVDDDPDVVASLVDELRHLGYDAHGVTSAAQALQVSESRRFDAIVTDVIMPDIRGLELLAALRARSPQQVVILMTAFGSIQLAVQAVKAGASDFLTKPFPLEALTLTIERALQERQLTRELHRLRSALSSQQHGDIVARSHAMRRALDFAMRAATSDATVLLTGESGVGKGELAKLIHQQSSRKDKPLIHFNCAALPIGLAESELFGVKRGAYTDAHEDRRGVFERANGGTLFLDEFAEMSLDVQPKLLHTLESGMIQPVGSGKELRVNVRLIAATNRPLDAALRDKTLRADLYHRLNVIRVDIPPLRERPEDLDPLVEQLLQRLIQKTGRAILGITDEAMGWIRTYHWPGNVRELANALERAFMLADGDLIQRSDVALPLPPHPDGWSTPGADLTQTKPLQEIERDYILHVLELTDWNKGQAARILGLDRRTLYRKAAEILAEHPDRGPARGRSRS